jgi:dienelactone hydrolase
MTRYFVAMAQKRQPRYRFAGTTPAHWRAWHKTLLPKAKASLGQSPQQVPLNAQVTAQWQADGLIKQRIEFDVEPDLSAVALLFRPESATKANKVPGIIACHGHGTCAKEGVMGNQGHAAEIAAMNYDYGLQMAKAGYAVIAIDWRGFGERSDRRWPNSINNYQETDECSAHYQRATMFNMTSLGMNVHDGMRAIDLLAGQDFVDPARIGAMGLSFGGTMTTWLAICDPRVKAADIVCYSDRFIDFTMRDNNACGSQITPGLYDLCDVPDLQGLIAPKPLLVEIGTFDECFNIDSATSCHNELRKIYQAAGAIDKLELDLFEGGHKWSGRKAFRFFKEHLGH